MKKIRAFIISFVAVLGLVALPVVPVAAEDCNGPADCIQQGTNKVGGDKVNENAFTEGIKTVVNVLLFILGAIAVIMIIIGGIRYTTSGGDANSTKAAKDTIMYAVIGLVVAILAYAIVNWVLSAFSNK